MIKKLKDRSSGEIFIVAFIVVAAMIIGSTVWAIRATTDTVNQVVDELSTFYMEELIGKREIVLRDSLNNDFNLLDRVVSLLKSKNIQTQDSLREFLADAQMLYGADTLAVVDNDNIVYTPNATFTDASRYTFLQKGLTGPQIVTSKLYGAKKQVILAIPIDNYRFNDKQLVACFMQINIDDLAGSLSYDDITDSNVTYVGLYYKNGENLTSSAFGYVGSTQNLLDYVNSSHSLDQSSFEEISRNFQNGGRGIITTEHNGKYEYIYYMPVKDTDWMLAVMVHDNTIANQLKQASEVMLTRNLIQVLFISVSIIAIFVIFIVLSRRNAEMSRKQQILEIKVANEEALKAARDEAERANKAKTDFLFNMSHDIRTPMNAIIGFSQIIKKELDNPGKVKSHLKKLQKSSLYLLSILNNILDMARIESGKAELNIDIINLADMDRSVADMFSEEFKNKNLHFSLAENISHKFVYADSQKLQQVISNLLSNSIKYTPAGGSVSLSTNELPCQKEGFASYEITVSDTGIGMSEEFQKHIFESFTRERTTTENNVIGTGLGMAIVKNLVEMMGGTVSLESDLEKGSTFRINLTFRFAEDFEDYITKQSSPEVDSNVFEGKRILLAEDNEINAEIAAEILEEKGFKVERAADGVQCVDMLSKAENGYYDLILMDIQMPNMNGYDATVCIRQLADKAKAGIPIVAMTANAFEEDRQNALKAGMNGHLGKPIDIAKLTETLSDILG